MTIPWSCLQAPIITILMLLQPHVRVFHSCHYVVKCHVYFAYTCYFSHHDHTTVTHFESIQNVKPVPRTAWLEEDGPLYWIHTYLGEEYCFHQTANTNISMFLQGRKFPFCLSYGEVGLWHHLKKSNHPNQLLCTSRKPQRSANPTPYTCLWKGKEKHEQNVCGMM